MLGVTASYGTPIDFNRQIWYFPPKKYFPQIFSCSATKAKLANIIKQDLKQFAQQNVNKRAQNLPTMTEN